MTGPDFTMTVEEREAARERLRRESAARARTERARVRKEASDRARAERRVAREREVAERKTAREKARDERRRLVAAMDVSEREAFRHREQEERVRRREEGAKPPETFEGTALRQFEESEDPTLREWIVRAREVAVELALLSPDRCVTVNDVREVCPPPEHRDDRCMGAVFRNVKASAHRGVWSRERVSQDSSRARGRPLCIFRWNSPTVRRDAA